MSYANYYGACNAFPPFSFCDVSSTMKHINKVSIPKS